MVQKCPVVGSVLWKSLRKGLSKSERARLLRELRKAYEAYEADKHYFGLDITDVSAAFLWRSTPQGWKFWNATHVDHCARIAARK